MVADDEPHFREIFHDLLVRQNHNVICAADKDETLRKMLTNDVHLLLLDKRFPEDRDGMETLKQVRKIRPRVEVIVLTAFPDAESNLEAISEGAAAYLLKTGEYDRLLTTVNHLLEVIDLRRRNEQLFEDLKEKNARLEEIRSTLKRWNEKLLGKLEQMNGISIDSGEIHRLLESQDSGLLALSLIHEVNNKLQIMGSTLEFARDSDGKNIPNVLNDLFLVSSQIAEIMRCYSTLILFRSDDVVPFSFEKMLDKSIFLAKWLCEKPDFEVRKIVETEIPKIVGFESQMISAFYTLLKSCIDSYKDDRQGWVRLVSLRVSCFEKTLVVDLEGAGSGTLPMLRESLTEGKFSEEASVPRIGLKIAKKAIERDGGFLVLEDRNNGAYRLRISFPLNRRQEGKLNSGKN